MSLRQGFKLRFGPRSLLGQMLLAVAVALLVAQGISAGLVWRAQEQRRESALIGSLAFQLVAEPRFDYREGSRGDRPWRRLRIEHASQPPLLPGETRDPDREEELRAMLTDQGIRIAELVVFERPVAKDGYVTEQLAHRPRMKGVRTGARAGCRSPAFGVKASRAGSSPACRSARGRTPISA